MGKAVDAISMLLLIGAVTAFALGMHALGERRDLSALYFLVVGGLALRAATEMLRPRSGAR